MKRLIMLILLAAVLCGCSKEPPVETTVPIQTTVMTMPTEPRGFYIPESAAELTTGGAVRVFAPEDTSCYAIAMMGEDVLLFTGERTTTLTRLTGDNLYPVAQIQLDCHLYPEEVSFQISEKGITYFDIAANAVVFLDNNLKEVNRVPIPEGIQGVPVLSSNRLKLYYCTQDAIRVLDLETGLDRLLKQIAYTYQTVEGILFDDSVLQCFIADENSYTIFISTETGEMIGDPLENQKVTGFGENYYAVLSGGVIQELVYGTLGEEPRMLTPADPFGFTRFLERAHGAVTASCGEGTTYFAYYDLEDGRCSAAVEIAGAFSPWYVEPDGTGNALYMMGHDDAVGQIVIYRWDLTKTAVQDETVYASPWYTLDNPDTEGLAECASLARIISEKNGLDILIGQEAADIQPWDYEMEPEYQVPVIMHELQKLDALLDMYPEGFFDTIDEDIKISLVRSLRGSAESGSLEIANGIQFWEDGKAYVAAACGESLEKTLFHELFHIVDNHVLSACNAYYDWELLNPKGFSYDYDYIANQNRDPEEYLDDETRAFIDRYSMSFPKEDRARIMEYAATEGNARYFQSEIMQQKLRTLCKGIREAFDLRSYPNMLIWEQYLLEPLVK